jgi:hypothetical protein
MYYLLLLAAAGSDSVAVKTHRLSVLTLAL